MEMKQVLVSVPLEPGPGLEYVYEYRCPNAGDWFLAMTRKKGWVHAFAEEDLGMAVFILKRSKPCLLLVE